MSEKVTIQKYYGKMITIKICHYFVIFPVKNSFCCCWCCSSHYSWWFSLLHTESYRWSYRWYGGLPLVPTSLRVPASRSILEEQIITANAKTLLTPSYCKPHNHDKDVSLRVFVRFTHYAQTYRSRCDIYTPTHWMFLLRAVRKKTQHLSEYRSDSVSVSSIDCLCSPQGEAKHKHTLALGGKKHKQLWNERFIAYLFSSELNTHT